MVGQSVCMPWSSSECSDNIGHYLRRHRRLLLLLRGQLSHDALGNLPFGMGKSLRFCRRTVGENDGTEISIGQSLGRSFCRCHFLRGLFLHLPAIIAPAASFRTRRALPQRTADSPPHRRDLWPLDLDIGCHKWFRRTQQTVSVGRLLPQYPPSYPQSI